MKTQNPIDMSIPELIKQVRYFTDLVRAGAITIEKERELGMPYWEEYNRKRQSKISEIAIRNGKKPRKVRSLRWDERHLVRVI